MFPHEQYCRKYGGKHDDLAPFVVNQHRNGLLTPWGYNATHKVPQLTIEDYVNSRYVLNPLRLWDCDRPAMHRPLRARCLLSLQRRHDPIHATGFTRYHEPVLAMLVQGSAGGSASPACSSSMEMPSGVRIKAMRPSRGGRLIVTP